MVDDELAFSSAWDLRRLIDSRQVSIVELTEQFLRRIEHINPLLNAYLSVTGDEAMASAQAAQEALQHGDDPGTLHGIPISIKDLELTKGIRTTMGSLLFKDHVPDRDTIVVERMRSSGAIILGKTNTPEFGLSGTTENRLGDACRNPWNRERTAGGSSGGTAAAVAAGLCTLATGSDAGGSIRIPSSFCGVFGIKPTQGRVPRYGGVGRPAYSTLAQAGPITRTVKDAALLLQVLAGPDARDPSCIRYPMPNLLDELDHGVKGLRLGWSPDLGFAAVDPEVLTTTSRGAQEFQGMGCTVEEAELALDDPFSSFWVILTVSCFTSFGHLMQEDGQHMADYTRNILERGREFTASDYSRALVSVQGLQGQIETLFEKYDLLLTPTVAVPAFPIGRNPSSIGGQTVEPFLGFSPFTYPFNMTMQPVATVPCGFSSDGMPIGLQIVGRMGEEATVLRASAAFEQARPWASMRPP